MIAIFSNFLGDSLEVFMDNFFVFGDDFDSYLAHLTKNPRGMRQETTGIELGEIPFYGARGSSARASRLRAKV